MVYYNEELMSYLHDSLQFSLRLSTIDGLQCKLIACQVRDRPPPPPLKQICDRIADTLD
jgi:hypothetical protein